MSTVKIKHERRKRLEPILSSQREVPGRKYGDTKMHLGQNTDDELNYQETEQQNKESALGNKETQLKRRETELNHRETELKKKEIALKNEETELMNKGIELTKRESEIKEKETKLKYKEAEVKNMDAEMKTNEAKINYKEAEVKCKEADVKYKEAEIINKEAEVKHREAEVKRKEAEFKKKEVPNMLHVSEIEKIRNELASKQSEINKLTTELTNDKEKIERLEKENKRLKIQNGLLTMDYDFEKVQKSMNISEETMVKQLTDENKGLRQQIQELTSAPSNNRSDDATAKQVVSKQISHTVRRRAELSKVIGAKITDGNPDIADLSDMNRPTKLAEKYAELYDNEWTEAYEELETKRKLEEKKVIETLLSNLKDVYVFCQNESKDYEANIKKSALAVPGAGDGRPKTPNLTAISRKLFVDLRKTFAPFLIDDLFKKYKKKNEKKLNGYTKMTEYIKTCIEICWLMSVQDPPVVLDVKDPKGPFDGDKYKTYTKSGKTFDYIVWPPMCLKESGPLLGKGVAQAK